MSGAAALWLLAGAAIAAPAHEGPGRTYVARSRAACEAIDYTCSPGTTSFQNDAGCGCEPTRSPPERRE